MICAIVKNDMVENTIIIHESQIPEMEQTLNCELVDARPYGLAIGDLRTLSGWTRNNNGEQMILPLLDQKQNDSYTIAMNRAAEAEASVVDAEERTVNEVLSILTGEIE